MICVVNLLRKEETFFHAYTEICNPFNFFSMFWVNYKLWEPKWINKLLTILDNIIKDQVQENKEFYSH